MSQAGALQRNDVAEIVIGAIVVAVIVILLAFGYAHTGSGAATGYELDAHMPKVDGLGVGTDVRLAGIKIGTVSDLTLDSRTYLVTVHMNIRNDVKIPVDSSLLVTQSGFLGAPYLSITPGGDDKMLAAGSFFDNVQGSIDLINLVGRIAGGDKTSNQAPAGSSPPSQPKALQNLPSGP